MMRLRILSLLIWIPAGFARADVTWTEHVAPLVYRHCVECHRPGKAAPFSLLTYENARRRARTMVAVTEDRYMPPWQPAGGDVPLAGERGLSGGEIRLLRAWYEAGAPEGDARHRPDPPVFADGWRLGTPDLVLEMEEAFELPAEGPDIYRNFLIRTGLKRERWLKAIEFQPGSPSVVHHCLFYLDDSGAAREADRKDPGPGFDEMPIGEGMGRALGGWVPGARPLPLPEGVAWCIPAGADLILSTHFHLSGKPERERSRVGLHFGKKPARKKLTTIQLPPVFGAFAGIRIEPGESSATLEDRMELPVAVEAFGITAHAHYLGKSLRLTARLPDGEELVLLNIPDWDFAWQEEYRFREPVSLPAGTELVSRVVWDNSEENPDNPAHPPVRVHWGRESLDEMGSLLLLATTSNARDAKALRRALSEHLRWQAGHHLLSPRKLKFAGELREEALRKFDADGDDRLDGEERERARVHLRRNPLP